MTKQTEHGSMLPHRLISGKLQNWHEFILCLQLEVYRSGCMPGVAARAMNCIAAAVPEAPAMFPLRWRAVE